MAMFEDAKITNLRTSKFRVNGISGNMMWQDIEFTVGTEDTNVVNVSCQLKDGDGNNLTNAAVVDVYISDTAGGAVATSAPDGAAAVGTYGTIIDTITTGKHYLVNSGTDGLFDLDVTESGTDTFYLNAIHPVTGEIYSSAVMTFTA